MRPLCLFRRPFVFSDAHGLPTGMVLREVASLMQLHDRLPTRWGLAGFQGDVLQRLFLKRQVSEFAVASYHVTSSRLPPDYRADVFFSAWPMVWTRAIRPMRLLRPFANISAGAPAVSLFPYPGAQFHCCRLWLFFQGFGPFGARKTCLTPRAQFFSSLPPKLCDLIVL